MINWFDQQIGLKKSGFPMDTIHSRLDRHKGTENVSKVGNKFHKVDVSLFSWYILKIFI